ncbi:hypothetical protein [Aestuariibaculum suncheonense]|uniref:Uncharacterized protein n=1 Tax=Aestuariibaculum suncheonense TaxID=1028745 RepID=A0A8J6QB32_9FLAO|nr:hypothetical protein [Aestuariibaculum suncheonense]MBD0834455.1 hypothetical protein [Aestuariibaculum suncheonense]
MGVLSKSLKNYINTYTSRLDKYLDDYEDNTESLFLLKDFDTFNETLEILNTYKTNSKSFGFQTLKDHFDISILENSGFDLDKVDNHIASINRILDFIKQKQEFIVSVKAQNGETYKEEIWFKVGVMLASGEMSQYYTVNSDGIMRLKNSYTAPLVAEELGDKNWQKVVLGTLKNYSPENTNANKNIFNSRDKMMKIINHCKEKGIPVISHFTDRLPPE